MNLRDIKKDIEYVIGEFIEDCSLFIALNSGSDSKNIDALIDEAVELYNNLKDKVSHPEGENKKAFYNNIRKELLEKVDGLCERLSEAVSGKGE